MKQKGSHHTSESDTKRKITGYRNADVNDLKSIPNHLLQYHIFTYLTDPELFNVGATKHERMASISVQCIQG